MEFLYAAARGDAAKLRHVRSAPLLLPILASAPAAPDEPFWAEHLRGRYWALSKQCHAVLQ